MRHVLDFIATEPVRLRLYGLAVLAGGYLVASGKVSATDWELIVGLVATVLGVERSRARVEPIRNKRVEGSD